MYYFRMYKILTRLKGLDLQQAYRLCIKIEFVHTNIISRHIKSVRNLLFYACKTELINNCI